MLSTQLFTNKQPLWVALVTSEQLEKPPRSSLGLLDWYNNFLITKTLKSKKLDLLKGEKTLIATTGIVPAQSLLVYSVGHSSKLDLASIKEISQDLSTTLEGLKQTDALVILPNEISSEATASFKKALHQAKIFETP